MGLMSLFLSILGAILRMMAAMGSLICFAVSQGASLGKAEKAAIRADKKTPSASYKRNQLAASTLAVLRRVFLMKYALACGCMAWCFAVPAMIMFLTGFACLLVSAAWKAAKLCWSFACVAFKMAAIVAVAVLCAFGLLAYAGYLTTWLCCCVLGYRGPKPDGSTVLNILVPLWMFGCVTGLNPPYESTADSAWEPVNASTAPVDSAAAASCSPDANDAAARDDSLPSVSAPSDNTSRPRLQLERASSFDGDVSGRFSDDLATNNRDVDRDSGATPAPATAESSAALNFLKAPASAPSTPKGTRAGIGGAVVNRSLTSLRGITLGATNLRPSSNLVLSSHADRQASPAIPTSAQPAEASSSSISGVASPPPCVFESYAGSSSLSSLGAAPPGESGFAVAYRQGDVGFVRSQVVMFESPAAREPISGVAAVTATVALAAANTTAAAAGVTTTDVVAAVTADEQRVAPACMGVAGVVVGGVAAGGEAAAGLAAGMPLPGEVLHSKQASVWSAKLSAEVGHFTEWLGGHFFAAL